MNAYVVDWQMQCPVKSISSAFSEFFIVIALIQENAGCDLEPLSE